MVTKSEIKGSARAGAMPTQRFSIAANTDVSKGYSTSVQSFDPTRRSSALGRSTLTVASTSSNTRIDMVEYSTGASSSPLGGYAVATGRNEVLVTLRSKTPIAGRLSMTTSDHASIDIHADGHIDVPPYWGVTADVVIGPSGLRLVLGTRSRIGHSGFGNNRETVRARVTFEAGLGEFTVDGGPCRGPVLEGYFELPTTQNPGLLRLDATGIIRGTSSLFALGTRNPCLQMPPLGCTLLTDIVIGVGAIPRNGAARLDIRFPHGTRLPRGLALRTQFLTVSGGGWVSSNALALRFR